MHFLHGLRVSIKSLFCQKLNLHYINSISLCLRPISIHSVKPCSWRQGLAMNDNEGQNFIISKSDQFLYNFSKYRTKNFRRKETFHCFGEIFFFRGVQNNFSFSKVDVMHFIHHNNPYHCDL